LGRTGIVEGGVGGGKRADLIRRACQNATETDERSAMSLDDLQKQHEGALAPALAALTGKGKDSDFALARALIHKAVHLVAEQKAAEFCAVATFLAEMIGHAHGFMHPGDKGAPDHGAFRH
jgi:hypothetical protein